PETAHGLTTRAELVEKIRVLGQDVLDGVKFGFDNAVDQLKVLNPRVDLNTEGLSMLKRVENGEIVIPPEYA
ncbi:pentatricopeptide repeat-containing protein, partial [Trifolium medium]|nr:pentatricopeptide repeat-containing protein [Trifolium medium]